MSSPRNLSSGNGFGPGTSTRPSTSSTAVRRRGLPTPAGGRSSSRMTQGGGVSIRKRKQPQNQPTPVAGAMPAPNGSPGSEEQENRPPPIPEDLKELYLDVSKSGSFRNGDKLYAAACERGLKYTRAEVRKFLKSLPVYSLWRPARRNYTRNPIRGASGVGKLFQFDLMSQQEFPETYPADSTDQYHFELVGIDSYSRFAFAQPLKGRSSDDVQRGLAQIFATGYKPEKILCDSAG